MTETNDIFGYLCSHTTDISHFWTSYMPKTNWPPTLKIDQKHSILKKKMFHQKGRGPVELVHL